MQGQMCMLCELTFQTLGTVRLQSRTENVIILVYEFLRKRNVDGT